jgi:Ni,Fe-hydrogenase III small subunit/Pyruvate/2-oxoacid:ferredoxin oxidoreductase delta subunit
MIQALIARLREGYWTYPFPKKHPTLPDRFRGLPVIDASKCSEGCGRCVEVCPTKAVAAENQKIRFDLGRCLFCDDCARSCPSGAIRLSREYRLAVRKREDLCLEDGTFKRAQALDRKARRLFGRSLKLRQISAGGCNACEADTNVLNTLVFDLGRFGVQFVASPRHADGILVTGAVSENMREALLKTYAAVPSPKLVIAVGACAISGGPYRDHPEVCNGVTDLLPVDLLVPGCPPHPWTILDGLLRILGRI